MSWLIIFVKLFYKKLKIVIAYKVFDKMLNWKYLEFSFNCLSVTLLFLVLYIIMGYKILIGIEISSNCLILYLIFVIDWNKKFTLSLKIRLFCNRICEWFFFSCKTVNVTVRLMIFLCNWCLASLFLFTFPEVLELKCFLGLPKCGLTALLLLSKESYICISRQSYEIRKRMSTKSYSLTIS